LGKQEVTSLDIRENRLFVGVKDLVVTNNLSSSLEAAGVPIDAVEFEEVQPAANFASLTGKVRLSKGGLIINEPGVGCTIGYNIEIEDSGNPAFFTAAHCAPPFDDASGKSFYQPASGVSGSYVGDETYDISKAREVSAYNDDCPSGKTCYYADAMIVEYPSGTSINARVARPERKWDTRGTSDRREIDSSNPSFTVKSLDYNAFEGERLHKVGWRTGWTAGDVVNNCKDIETNGGSVVNLCQSVVEKPSSAPSGRRISYYGDSGAPVFKLKDEKEDGDVEQEAPIAKGVLWGGDPSTGDTFYLSPFQALRGDGFTTASGFPAFYVKSYYLDD
jgi:hypothetical protein